MRPIATNDPVAWCANLSVCLFVTRLSCEKTAEWIEVLFLHIEDTLC